MLTLKTDKVNSMTRSSLSALVVSALLLAGCAPHPATGNWVPAEGDESGFVRIHVQYDGKTDIYRPGEETAAFRCFWAGESGAVIGLQCVLAENTDIEKHFKLNVTADQGARLEAAGKVIGFYRRSAVK
ncbi:MAG: hypothetical protein ABW082_01075 [Sedimenticola sp.]